MTIRSHFWSRLFVCGLTAPFLTLTADAQNVETRSVGEFTAISVSGGIDLSIRQGDDFVVEVMASSGNVDRIITEVHGDTLEIRRMPGEWRFFDSERYEASVVLPRLTELTASGGSDVRTEGRITGDRLEIRASGGSDIRIDVEVDELAVRTSGGSDAVLMGNVRLLDAATSGGSDLSASRLTASEAFLRSSGGSDITVDVVDRLVAHASGGSDIAYSGDPGTVEIDAGRSADVIKR